MVKGIEVAKLKKELLLSKETIAGLKHQNKALERKVIKLENVNPKK